MKKTLFVVATLLCAMQADARYKIEIENDIDGSQVEVTITL